MTVMATVTITTTRSRRLMPTVGLMHEISTIFVH